ncbi:MULTISPECIES: NAD(P)H-dependent glycerol-3-phosphate dehydrogenase [unclassified Novosphingobium]|uniref:NAD(P)H-dependent glycerol-3-phosphate dehydrogenase n=1 Tax=unclassified Novosphingobium TaxID=2644732 RepID=UPI000EB8D90C|nr:MULTISPECIES: NAD(P)H-dependent glycerol-3-phosphate dehydrogenase [unclassified Novosphingobium]HCF24319.1 glycerol-3-phosphate dehydrogenase [Novosphingobium sp.]HQV03837.1 NAD(P)H-dependent glycerol-3-phosphate dehydrogenase [Novosphingobium sp.]
MIPDQIQGRPIGVIGAGAWGTAIAQAMASDGTTVRLWARESEVVAAINQTRENTAFLPGIPLAGEIEATSDLGALGDCAALFVVTPAQHMRSVLAALPQVAAPLILCSKGIEAGSFKLLHQVAHESVAHAPIAVMSGPTFAHEVARGLPTAVTLAAEQAEVAAALAELIARPALRPYISTDLIGAEIGGAVKNVLAIACGVVDGLGLGQNARAALIARGYAEMVRFGLALGARAETMAGLSGMGDLVLTCSSTSSRNFSLGKALGEGQSAAEALAGKTSVAEGAHTAPVLAELAASRAIDMPIVEAVCRLLEGAIPARQVVAGLLARPLKAEGEGA